MSGCPLNITPLARKHAGTIYAFRLFGDRPGTLPGCRHIQERTMKHILCVTAALLLSSPAAAQLTTAQEGNLALGQCYSRCVGIAEDWYKEWNDYFHWLDDYLVQAVQVYTQEYLEDFLDIEDLFLCDDVQTEIQVLEACNVQCINVNEVYPDSTSSVKSRFLTGYNAAVAEAAASGLWTSYADTPAFGTDAFETACQTFWYGDETASQSSIERQSSVGGQQSFVRSERHRVRRRLFGGE